MADAPFVDGPPEGPEQSPNAPGAVAWLARAIQTASNDDYSEPMSDKRKRHSDRLEAMRNAQEVISRMYAITVSLEERLKPFSDAWDVAARRPMVVSHLSLAQLGALASHEVSGVHFKRACELLKVLHAAD